MPTRYVTKYALTRGILKVDAYVYSDSSMIRYREDGWSHYAHGNEFHETLEAAKARAEEMRLKRIASAEKSLVKLRAMNDYKVVEVKADR